MTKCAIIEGEKSAEMTKTFTFTKEVIEQLDEFKRFVEIKSDVKTILITYTVGINYTFGELDKYTNEILSIFDSKPQIQIQAFLDEDFEPDKKVITVDF